MASPSEPRTVSELLEAALGQVLGGPVEISDLLRLSGGASRETWSFTAQGRRLILRRDPPGRPGPPGAMRNEADALRACRRAGLAVPELILQSDSDARDHSRDGAPVSSAAVNSALLGTDGMVMSAVAGETIPRRILRDDKFSSARPLIAWQVAGFLAGLHAIDPAEVPGASAADDLATYRAAYDLVEDRSPAFERTFDWLRSHRPPAGRTTLVHGDLRMGNVIVDESGVAAVIDWELMHLGDPVEDLAWFCVKAWRFGAPLGAGGVGEIEEFLTAYEEASGHPVDRQVFRWWLVEKTLTWGVIAMGQAHAHLSGMVSSHELAAIGRRVAEQEWDLVELLAPESAHLALAGHSDRPEGQAPAGVSTPEATDDPGIFGRPTASEILDAVRGFLTDDVRAQTKGRLAYDARVAANMLAIVERQLAAETRDQPSYETAAGEDDPTWDSIARVVLAKVRVANPRYVA